MTIFIISRYSGTPFATLEAMKMIMLTWFCHFFHSEQRNAHCCLFNFHIRGFATGDFDQLLYEVLKRHQKSNFPLGMAYDVLRQAVLDRLVSRHVKKAILKKVLVTRFCYRANDMFIFVQFTGTFRNLINHASF